MLDEAFVDVFVWESFPQVVALFRIRARSFMLAHPFSQQTAWAGMRLIDLMIKKQVNIFMLTGKILHEACARLDLFG